MNFDTPKQEKPKKPVVINQPGFGKATNQATQIMIANGHFKNKAALDEDFIVYRELAIRIYKEDLKCIDQLKEELEE